MLGTFGKTIQLLPGDPVRCPKLLPHPKENSQVTTNRLTLLMSFYLTNRKKRSGMKLMKKIEKQLLFPKSLTL